MERYFFISNTDILLFPRHITLKINIQHNNYWSYIGKYYQLKNYSAYLNNSHKSYYSTHKRHLYNILWYNKWIYLSIYLSFIYDLYRSQKSHYKITVVT